MRVFREKKKNHHFVKSESEKIVPEAEETKKNERNKKIHKLGKCIMPVC